MTSPTEAPRTAAGQALQRGEIFDLTSEEDRRRLALAIEAEARRDAVTDAAQDWMRRAAEKKVAEAAALPAAPTAIEACDHPSTSLVTATYNGPDGKTAGVEQRCQACGATWRKVRDETAKARDDRYDHFE